METERQRDRQRQRQTDRQTTDRQTETEREVGGERERSKDRQTEADFYFKLLMLVFRIRLWKHWNVHLMRKTNMWNYSSYVHCTLHS